MQLWSVTINPLMKGCITRIEFCKEDREKNNQYGENIFQN